VEHPVTLLLLGAVLTNYLIPRIAQRWQDRQREIELKTAFLSEVSDAVLAMLMSVQYAEFGAESQSLEDCNRAYRTWETERARIAARMRGYFPATGLTERWRSLSDAITQTYAPSGTHQNSYRRHQCIEDLKVLLPDATVDWETLGDTRNKTGAVAQSIHWKEDVIHCYRRAWWGLREALLGHRRSAAAAYLYEGRDLKSRYPWGPRQAMALAAQLLNHASADASRSIHAFGR
jgi:hypothetical protein